MDLKAEQAKWEKLLEDEGLGMQAGKANWLSYGHEYYDKSRPAPEVTEVSGTYYTDRKRKEPTAREIAKAKVWGRPVPTAEEADPGWGYAGGYNEHGKRIKANPNTLLGQKIRQSKLGERIAVKPRSTDPIKPKPVLYANPSLGAQEDPRELATLLDSLGGGE